MHYFQILKRLDNINEKLDMILAQKSTVTSEPVPDHHIIDGENVMLWVPTSASKFALDLLAKLFSKEELAGSIKFCFSSSSPPSNGTLLPKDKVYMHSTIKFSYSTRLTFQIALIVRLVKEKFPDMNPKIVRQLMNQKCRYILWNC